MYHRTPLEPYPSIDEGPKPQAMGHGVCRDTKNRPSLTIEIEVHSTFQLVRSRDPTRDDVVDGIVDVRNTKHKMLGKDLEILIGA